MTAAALVALVLLAACGRNATAPTPPAPPWEDGEVTEIEAPAPARPTGPFEINTASAEELTSIPGVGPATARRIIEGRPYASIDDLDRVPGIGPRKIEDLRPYLFVARPDTAAAAGPLDLNTATVKDLAALEGLGPDLAEAIVKYREGNGPFRRVEELRRVPGIGPRRFAEIREHVVVR